MDSASSTRAAEIRSRVDMNCCKVICGALMTPQGYGVDQTRLAHDSKDKTGAHEQASLYTS